MKLYVSLNREGTAVLEDNTHVLRVLGTRMSLTDVSRQLRREGIVQIGKWDEYEPGAYSTRVRFRPSSPLGQ